MSELRVLGPARLREFLAGIRRAITRFLMPWQRPFAPGQTVHEGSAWISLHPHESATLRSGISAECRIHQATDGGALPRRRYDGDENSGLGRTAPRVIHGILLMVVCALPHTALGAFGLTTTTDYNQVDTGAGLVFKVRRGDYGSSTQSPGDIMSLVYNGIEYQNQSRGSQINSGFDWLGYPTSNVGVTAEEIGTDTIKITVTTDHLVHYYIARRGYPHICMATWFDMQPVTGGG